MLLKDGSQALQDMILSAEPYPIRGLFKCEPHSPAMMTCRAEPWVGWGADAPQQDLGALLTCFFLFRAKPRLSAGV